jgi:hypothetical protein
MNPTLVLIFGVAVLILLVVLAGIGIEIFRVLQSIEAELVEYSPKK